jgi:hypothetical protein
MITLMIRKYFQENILIGLYMSAPITPAYVPTVDDPSGCHFEYK